MYWSRKCIEYSITLLVIIAINFFACRLLPGDPFYYLSLDSELGYSDVIISEETHDKLIEYYGLDLPVYSQFFRFLVNLVHGDLGWSIYHNMPVSKLIMGSLPWTLLLMGTTFIIASFLGILIGASSAWKRDSLFDKFSLNFMIILNRIPSFIIAIFMLIFLAAKLNFFPLGGARTSYGSFSSNFSYLSDIIWHLILPAITLIIAELCHPFLLTRNTMVGIIKKDYVWAGRARELLSQCKLPAEKHYSYPVHLSGGELQRALIALTLVNEPEILVFDEPTNGLDPRTKKEIIILLRQIMDKKSGIIVSHDFTVLKELSHRIGILYAGQLIEMADSKSFFNNPRHPYSRALYSSFNSLETAREITAIRGKMYDAEERQEACVFAGRCTQSIEECFREKPSLEISGDRFLACHRGGVVDLLKGSNLSKTYLLSDKLLKKSSVQALKNVNIHIEAGEVVALVGESGAGKTTLGKIIARLLKKDEGEIIFDHTVSPLDVQYIFQDPRGAISHRFTVTEAVAEPLDIRKEVNAEERKQRVQKMLLQVGLPADEIFCEKHCFQLSSGELQRIAIARALIVKPRIVVADEPTSNLDPSEKARIIKLLLALQNANGMGLLLITHDMLVARKVSRRIYVMREGEIVEEGLSEKLLACSCNLYTRELMGQVNSEA